MRIGVVSLTLETTHTIQEAYATFERIKGEYDHSRFVTCMFTLY